MVCFTAAAPSPIQLQAKHAPRVTPPTAHATCAKQSTHGMCIPAQQPPAKRQHQPRTTSVHAQPLRRTASYGCDRHYERSTQKLQVRKTRSKCSRACGACPAWILEPPESPTVKCGRVLPRSHTQCRSSRTIVASTSRCPVPSRWAHTNSRFFRETARAGTQITRWPWCSTRYSP